MQPSLASHLLALTHARRYAYEATPIGQNKEEPPVVTIVVPTGANAL